MLELCEDIKQNPVILILAFKCDKKIYHHHWEQFICINYPGFFLFGDCCSYFHERVSFKKEKAELSL